MRKGGKGMSQQAREKFKLAVLKQQVLTHYGNGKLACVRCDFNDMRALSIDHIKNNGAEHRKSINRRTIYRWLADNNYPEGYQTLCMNCQFIKRYEPMYRNKPKKIVEQVRMWVDMTEQPFYTWQVYEGLGLPHKQRTSVRTELTRLKKAGVIRPVETNNVRHFGKWEKIHKVKPISVFRYLRDAGKR